MKKTINPKPARIAALSLPILFSSQTHATLVAYEGFEYVDALASPGDYTGNSGVIAESLVGKSDADSTAAAASGLAGSWAESTLSDLDDWFIVSGSLSFGDLPTNGNRVAYNSLLDSSNATRSLSTAAQSTIDLGSSLFFSILVNPTEIAGASRGGFAITDTNLAGGAITNTAGGSIGAGIGFGSPGNHSWRPYAWDSTTRFEGDAALAPNLNETYLMIGELSFNNAPSGADEYKLYSYQLDAGAIAGGSLSQIGSTIEVDLDETSLDLLNLNRQRYFEADEIRVGTTLDSVLGAPIPEPSSIGLVALAGLGLLRRRR